MFADGGNGEKLCMWVRFEFRSGWHHVCYRHKARNRTMYDLQDEEEQSAVYNESPCIWLFFKVLI